VTESALPRFTYHPDPVATGSIAKSEAECVACHQQRGWIYAGPVYCERDLDESLCPWCIADGIAHDLFGAEFVDPPAVGDYGQSDPVPDRVRDEICYRTPGFHGFQQERWFTHCHDAALFLGAVGAEELQGLDPAAETAIRVESGLLGEELEEYMSRLDKDYGPTAYIFRCRICGAWGGYSDVH
jgi:uncharacterized protein